MADSIDRIDEIHIDDAPNVPPRPQSPFSKTKDELKEAFPDVSENVVRAVLVASAGEMEPAFVGLLALNDASIRPARRNNGPNERQLQEDERMARQMADQYDRRLRHREQHGPVGRDGYAQPHRPPTHEGVGYDGYQTPRPVDKLPHNSSELQDDLEVFREDMQRRIQETSRKVGNLFNNLKERISNELNADKDLDRDDEYPVRPRRSNGYSRSSGGDWASRRESRAHSPHLHDDSPKLPARPKEDVKLVNTPAVNAFGEPNISWEPVKPETKEAAPASAFGIDESDEDDKETAAVKDKATAESGSSTLEKDEKKEPKS